LAVFGFYGSNFYAYDVPLFAEFANKRASQLGLADIGTGRANH